MNGEQIVMIVSGFPRRSETFALNELLALHKYGMVAAVFATKPGDGLPPQPGCAQLFRYVQILPPGPASEQAAFIVDRLAGRSINGVHAYFAHFPTEVAIQVARRLDIPYGFSTHAKDARKVAPEVLAERARQAAGVIACNPDVAETFRHSGVQVSLIPHGVDLQRFRPCPPPPNQPLRLLAIGRLVEKKGFEVLIRATAQLAVPFHLDIVGEGPEREKFLAAVMVAGLTNKVTFRGARTHDELPHIYAQAHVVVVPSIEDTTGDRDGLPNVVLEALASGRPVIASDVGAISSAIIHQKNGLLTPAGSVAALTEALEKLARQPALREQLSIAGRLHVEREYELGRCTERLRRVLTRIYA